MQLANKVVFVTGGAHGIGSACAKAVLEKGAKVVLADIDEGNGLKQTDVFKEEFGKGRVLFMRCDISRADDFKEKFNKAVEEFGKIDVVLNNAGVVDETQWTRTLDVNLKGVIHGTELAIAHMRKDKGGQGGVIINMASVAGYGPFFVFPVYAATKHGVIGYTGSLASAPDVATQGIRYACVCPELVATYPNVLEELKKKCRQEYREEMPMLMPKTLLTPSEVGCAVVSLIEDDECNGAVLEVSAKLGLVWRKLVAESF